MVDFDVILGIDWLHSFYASIDCITRIVRFQFPDEPILEWKGCSLAPMSRFISYLKARKMISKIYFYHLVWVKNSNLETPTLESVPVVLKIASYSLSLVNVSSGCNFFLFATLYLAKGSE